MKYHTLALALSIAVCAHISIYALLKLWPAPEQIREVKRIPVTLVVSAEQSASVASMSQAQSGAREQLLTSRSRSTFAQPIAAKEPNASTTKTSPNSSPNSVEQAKSNRQNTINRTASEKQLLSETSSSEQQISAKTVNAKHIMTPYEVKLLNHLLEGDLYNQFHTFMARAKEQEISFSIEITLFENGAIKSASLTQKNKNLPIDKLAITAAYNASPYPEPPEDDYKKHYRYQVMMSYDNNSLH